jgi:GMP synthase-like glutamine amidotransferase
LETTPECSGSRFRSQYTQLIARRREAGVYWKSSVRRTGRFIGLGRVASCSGGRNHTGCTPIPDVVFDLGVPILGSAGMQALAAQLGGRVQSSNANSVRAVRLRASPGCSIWRQGASMSG